VLSRGYKNERIYSTTSNQTMTGAIDVRADIQITPLDAEGDPISGGVELQNVGGSQPHNNMMPYAPITFGITLSGVFPSWN
ncbi:MAG: hypothetical protein K0R09_2332, partial [Clostridiales bacterium]|jgi:microcystin-dependent protein|nr:hypothetical protein [Clostridiales bacterium]